MITETKRNSHIERPRVRVMAKVDRLIWNRAKAIAAIRGVPAERWLEGVIILAVTDDRSLLPDMVLAEQDTVVGDMIERAMKHNISKEEDGSCK